MGPLAASSDLEQALWAQGFTNVGGVDEAGRGALAGPLVAAAVILSPDAIPEGLRDSKRLTALARDRLFGNILSAAVAHHIVVIGHAEIDRLGIHHANLLALSRAANGLAGPPDYLLSDGYAVRDACCPTLAVPKGDAVSVSVAAASIVAKVTRDRMMSEIDSAHPEYGLAKHKGYGTAEHLAALQKHGPSAVHRRSFGPVADSLGS
jgi:ribonuclease HII